MIHVTTDQLNQSMSRYMLLDKGIAPDVSKLINKLCNFIRNNAHTIIQQSRVFDEYGEYLVRESDNQANSSEFFESIISITNMIAFEIAFMSEMGWINDIGIQHEANKIREDIRGQSAIAMPDSYDCDLGRLKYSIMSKSFDNHFRAIISDAHIEFMAKQNNIRPHIETIDKFSKKIDDYSKRLESLHKYAQNLMSEYSFAGLSKSFKTQSENAAEQRDRWWGRSKLIGASMLCPWIFSMLLNIKNLMSDQPSWSDMAYRTLSISVIPTIIIAYFFRICLGQYKSAEAVELQYEHRYSLCAFIEGYANFKANNPNASLEKFEALAFSGITPDPGGIPTAFDGVDAISKVLESLRPKS